MSNIIVLILICLVVFGLAITNPSFDKHLVAIKERVNASASSEGISGAIMSWVGITSAAVDAMPIEYNNYIIFSTTTCEGATYSYGILGNVIVNE